MWLSESQCIFHKYRKNNPQICMEPQKSQDSQSNTEKENQSWMHPTSWSEAMLQSCSNLNSMASSQKQTQKIKKTESRARNKPMHIHPNCSTRHQEHTIGGCIISSTNGAGKTGRPHEEKWSSIPILHYAQQLTQKWIKDLKCKTWNYSTPRRKHREKGPQHSSWQQVFCLFCFFNLTPKAKPNKRTTN